MDGVFFSFLGKWSYLGLFVILLAAGLGVPLPEDIPLLAAGWLVHQGGADLSLMVLVGLIGVMLGDSCLFTMGRRYGVHIVEHRWLRTIARPWLLQKAREKYEKHGEIILFAARFMPGLRSVMFLTAGMFRVPYWKFLVIDGVAALISVPVWVWVGYKFTAHLEEIVGGARIASFVVGGLLAAALIVWGVYEYFRWLRRRNGRAVTEQQVAEIIRSAPLVSGGSGPIDPADAPVSDDHHEYAATSDKR